MATAIDLAHPTPDGIAPMTEVAADPTNGNAVPNSGTVLELRNSDTAAHSVTFDTPAQVSGYSVADETVSIAAGDTIRFGGWPQSAFGSRVVFTADSDLVMIAGYRV